MSSTENTISQEQKAIIEDLHLETAKIQWKELQRFFASGKVLLVSSDLDMLEIASTMIEDDAEKIKSWLDKKVISQPTDTQAKNWYESDAVLWALVLNPWVLIQEVE